MPIGPTDTTGDLHDRLAEMGAALIGDVLDRLPLPAAPQPSEGVTYAQKIDKAEARVDWTRSAAEVDRLIRGLSPFPGAWFEAPSAEGPVRIKALLSSTADGSAAPGTVLDDRLTVACGSGAVRLLRVQREGRAAQSAEDLLRGFPLPAGAVLG